MIARNHLLDIISGFRALEAIGAEDVAIVKVPSLGADRLHMSIDVGSVSDLRRLAREIGASEPERFSGDGQTWFGADLRLGAVTVRLTSEHLRAVSTKATSAIDVAPAGGAA